MKIFSAAEHHHTLLLLIQVAVLLLTARMLGELAQRYKQPSIVGELAAGILLGPSCLAYFVPAVAPYVMPQSEVAGHLLGVLTLLGSLFLLLNAGRETDLAIIRKNARTAVAVSVSGIVFPFIGGFCLGQTLPDFLLGEQNNRLLFSLFLGTALSISSVSIISKVLMDLKLLRRNIGQTTIAACTIDDTAGWILVSLVSNLARQGRLDLVAVGHAMLSLAIFLVANFTIGRWLLKRALAVVQDELISTDRLVSLVVVSMVSWAAVAMSLGLEPVVGAFFLGVLLASRRRFPLAVHEKLHSVARAVFVPLFFAVAGLKVQIIPLLTPSLLFYGLVFLFVASFGKVMGTYLGARLVGKTDHWTALALGAGMNARGSMEIIVATLGLTLGIVGNGMFSIIVVMAMVMSLLTPSALTLLVKKIPLDPEEEQRLHREEQAAESRIASVTRVLVPVTENPQGLDIYGYEANVVNRLAHGHRIAVTLLHVGDDTERAQSYMEPLSTLFARSGHVTVKAQARAGEVASAILREADKDYGLVVLGAVVGQNPPLSPLVDQLVREAPCMTMVVRPALHPQGEGQRRFLVPTNGRPEAAEAANLAILMAGPGDQIHFLHVLERDKQGDSSSVEAAYEFVGRLRQLASAHNVDNFGELRLEGERVGDVILNVIETRQIDVVVLGVHLRATADRVYLGSRVERVVAQAPCTVLLLHVI